MSDGIRSQCCGAAVRTSDGPTTYYYVCTACGNACAWAPAGDLRHIRYPSPEVTQMTGERQAMGVGIDWWAATEHDPEHYSIGWARMTPDQVRKFAHQLLQIIGDEPSEESTP